MAVVAGLKPLVGSSLAASTKCSCSVAESTPSISLLLQRKTPKGRMRCRNLGCRILRRSPAVVVCSSNSSGNVSVSTEAETTGTGSSQEATGNWVPVVPLSTLPRGERRLVRHGRETVLLLWYKNDVYAIENQSPAEGAYSNGLINARLTPEGCIICPSTESTYDLKTGKVVEWMPTNPILRFRTPSLRDLITYPVKVEDDYISINVQGRRDLAEIVFGGPATGQAGRTATNIDGDEKEPLLPTPNHLEFPKNVAAKFCDYLERAILWYFDDYGSKKKHPWFEGNYAPTTEMAPKDHLSVTGTIPDCMNGEFMRVGPNPRFFPPTSGLHWFDGDGMLHGLKMKDGQATYVSRYVRTSRLEQEEKFGAPKFLKLGDTRGVSGIMYIMLDQLRMKLGVLDVSNGQYTGNTALVYHGGKIMALNEGDKPYIIKVLEDGDLETIGRESYEGRLGPTMTAHPKLDPVTGELFTFGYDISRPHIYYHVVSKEGAMSEATVITLPRGVMMHDFAITENYAIFMDLPMVLNPQGMAKGKMAISFDEKKEARFGVLPRYATNESQLKWFTIPPCYIYHNASSWEEGDEIVLYSCRLSEHDLAYFLEDKPQVEQTLYEFRMNLKTGEAKQKKMGELIIDFPTINEKYVGRKHSYSYALVFDEKHRGYGIAKYNLLREPQFGLGATEVGGNLEGLFAYGPGRFGGEVIFVPRSTEPETEEDDGYLITFVHDENHGMSEAVIFDAKTMAAEPVAVVKLPNRVPYGFHAIFVSEEQLKMQSGVQAS